MTISKSAYLAFIKKHHQAKSKPTTTSSFFGADVLGDFQATVLATILQLDRPANATEIIEAIFTQTSEPPDVAQTYAVLKILAAAELIQAHDQAKPDKGRKPPTLYTVTKKGRTAISHKQDRLERLLAYISVALDGAVDTPSRKKA